MFSFAAGVLQQADGICSLSELPIRAINMPLIKYLTSCYYRLFSFVGKNNVILSNAFGYVEEERF